MAKFTGHTITPDSALGGIQLERSLRFNNDDSAYLNRTPSSESIRRAVTLSVWIKRCNFGEQMILDAFINDSHRTRLMIDAGNRMQFFTRYSGNDHNLITNAIQRDVSSWYHFVYAINTNESTASNRVKCYINGEQQTFIGSNYPDQEDLMIGAICNHTIGVGQDSGGNEQYFDGYMAEMHCIDGTQLDPTYFGYTESQTGLWRPKKYEGTYGTNGFYLDFSDNSSTSALGKDTSGNGNNFTVNNFSVASGVTNDSMIDTPTNNWCVWNGLTDVSDITLSEGNLKSVSGADSWPAVFGTHGASSGKWYYEAVGADNTRWGLGWSTEEFKSGTSNTFSVGHFAYSQDPLTFYQDGSNIAINGTPAFTTGNVLQIATDIDAGKTWFGINNTWVNASNGSAGDPAAGTNPTITFSEKGQKHYPKMINNLGNVSVNFGQQGFTYTPPDGFQALNSKTLATVNAAGVVRPQRHFGVLSWTGNDSSQTIDGLEFTPDFVWIKARRSGEHHFLTDVIRGAGLRLQTSSSNVESDRSSEVTSFVRGGFTIAGTHNEINGGGVNIIGMCWKAGGAAVSNSDGSITSQVSANQEAGFSIVTFSITSNAVYTVGHGLGKAPQWIMMKARNTTNNWDCYHVSVGNTKRIKMNDEVVPEDYTEPWNDTTPTSSVFTSTGSWLGGNGTNCVAYCWTEIPGYSKFGEYVGNGSSDGPYVHLGFKPAFIIYKKVAGGSDNWEMQNTTIDTDNPVNESMYPNTSGAQNTGRNVDFLANGFKIRNTNGGTNEGTGYTYIYMAWADKPSGTMFGLDANAR